MTKIRVINGRKFKIVNTGVAKSVTVFLYSIFLCVLKQQIEIEKNLTSREVESFLRGVECAYEDHFVAK